MIKKISRVIPLLSLLISLFALINSCQTKRDMRIVQGLTLEPLLIVNAFFYLNERPFFIVKNIGPISAQQVILKITFLKYYDDQTEKMRVGVTGSDLSWNIPELPPFTPRAIYVDQAELKNNLQFLKPEFHNVLQLSISYKRPADKKAYSRKAYYFVSPEGRWILENSVKGSEYDQIKRAALKWNVETDEALMADKLHKSLWSLLEWNKIITIAKLTLYFSPELFLVGYPTCINSHLVVPFL